MRVPLGFTCCVMAHSLIIFLWAYFCQQFHYFALHREAGGANLSSLPFSYGLLSGGLDTSVSNNPLIRQWWTIHLVCKAANLPIHWAEPSAVIRRPTLMISASGSNPLEHSSKCTLILQVIQLMNDPGPEAVADPTLIMLREPHLGGTVGPLANSGDVPLSSCTSSPVQLQSESPKSLGKGEPVRQIHRRHCNLDWLQKHTLWKRQLGVISSKTFHWHWRNLSQPLSFRANGSSRTFSPPL